MIVRLRRGLSAVDVATTTVFVGLIALVIVPILGGLREQSRIATCISNLGTIGRAQTVYYGEYENLPWCVPFGYTPDGFPSVSWDWGTELSWGGGMPDKQDEDYVGELLHSK